MARQARDPESRFRTIEEGAARVRTLEEEAQEILLRDLERPRTGEATSVLPQKTVGDARAMLVAAHQSGRQMQADLRELTVNLEQRLLELGETVRDSTDFQGAVEHILALFGKIGVRAALAKAEKRRLLRLQTQPIQESLQIIARLTSGTIEELGKIERQEKKDVEGQDGYNATIEAVLKKLNEAQPLYKRAKAEREDLEVQITALKRDLESGAIEENLRPSEEQRLDGLQRKLAEVAADEQEQLVRVQKAQEALPILRDARQAKLDSIQGLHLMRRSLFEKHVNLRVMMETVLTTIVARAKAERYLDLDPAFNFCIDQILKLLVQTATSIMRTAMERAQKAAVDPDQAQAYASELAESMENFAAGLRKLDEAIARGRSVPTDGHEASGDGQPRED